MAQRDMVAVADSMSGKIPERYQLTLSELRTLHKMTEAGEAFEAYIMAFRYGFALALRMAKRNTQKAKAGQAAQDKQGRA